MKKRLSFSHLFAVCRSVWEENRIVTRCAGAVLPPEKIRHQHSYRSTTRDAIQFNLQQTIFIALSPKEFIYATCLLQLPPPHPDMPTKGSLRLRSLWCWTPSPTLIIRIRTTRHMRRRSLRRRCQSFSPIPTRFLCPTWAKMCWTKSLGSDDAQMQMLVMEAAQMGVRYYRSTRENMPRW